MNSFIFCSLGSFWDSLGYIRIILGLCGIDIFFLFIHVDWKLPFCRIYCFLTFWFWDNFHHRTVLSAQNQVIYLIVKSSQTWPKVEVSWLLSQVWFDPITVGGSSGPECQKTANREKFIKTKILDFWLTFNV